MPLRHQLFHSFPCLLKLQGKTGNGQHFYFCRRVKCLITQIDYHFSTIIVPAYNYSIDIQPAIDFALGRNAVEVQTHVLTGFYNDPVMNFISNQITERSGSLQFKMADRRWQ